MGVVRGIVDTLVRKETPLAKDVTSIFNKAKSAVSGVVQKSQDLRATARNDSGSYPKIQQRIGDYLGGTGQATLDDEKKKLDQALRQNTFKPPGLTPNKPAQTSPSIDGEYDETSFRNPQIKARGADTPRIGAELGPGLTITQNGQGTVSLFNADGTKADPSKTRLSGGNLGGTPLPAGQSPFFMKSQAAQGLVPQPGTVSAIPGMQQSPAVTMPGGNMTGMFAQDDAIFKARMANVGQDYRIGTGNPAFASDPQMAQSLARRNSLQASLDTFNRQNPLRQGASVGDIISNRAATSVQRKELERLNADIFGRSDLGTKLQMAMLDSLTKKDISRGDNQTALAKQGLENEGQWATRSMMEGSENLRHAASLQAGVGQPKPGADPFEKVGPDAIQAVLKAHLDANPNMPIEDITALVNNLKTRLSGKPGGQLASVLETIKN